MTKPHYPAKWFHRRFEFPVKHCERCGARLLPMVRKNGTLETPNEFARRNSCGRPSACRDVTIAQVRFPLQPSNPSLGRIDEETREMLAQALNNHPEMLEVWPEVVG